MSASIKDILKPVLWDYNINVNDFYDVATGVRERVGGFDQQRALVRVFERLDWYDILEVFGIQFVEEHLTPDIISRIRFADLRKRYDIIRRILHGEPVSFAGWSVATAERARNAVLSNRWYRTEPALL